MMLRHATSFRSAAIAAFAIAALAWPARADKPLEGRTIVVDPGHAVLNHAGQIINPGARARLGAYERDVALSVSKKVLPLLEAQGAKVIMTRTDMNPWRYSHRKQADNRSRAIFANSVQGDAYVRVHADWNRSRKFNGFTMYYFRWGSRPLAKAMREAFVAALPEHRDNGIHRRSFVSITAKMPTVLVELGVLSYKREAKLLAEDAFQQRLAEAVCDGVVRYFKGEGAKQPFARPS
jgi:N-acetylmuramoyl-L-alanine amidase